MCLLKQCALRPASACTRPCNGARGGYLVRNKMTARSLLPRLVQSERARPELPHSLTAPTPTATCGSNLTHKAPACARRRRNQKAKNKLWRRDTTISARAACGNPLRAYSIGSTIKLAARRIFAGSHNNLRVSSYYPFSLSL